MRRSRACLLLLPMMLSSAAHAGEPKAFCVALANLAEVAATTGQRQEVAVLVVEPTMDEPMVSACSRRSDVAARVAFCDSVAKHVSIEFAHAFPWMVDDCLRAAGAETTRETVDEYTGLGSRSGKIVGLRSILPSGVTLAIRFKPASGQESAAPQFRRLYGRYDLTLTP